MSDYPLKDLVSNLASVLDTADSGEPAYLVDDDGQRRYAVVPAKMADAFADIADIVDTAVAAMRISEVDDGTVTPVPYSDDDGEGG